MANHKIKILIYPEDIRRKISPECKDVIMTKAELLVDGSLSVECLVSYDDVVKHDDVSYLVFRCEDSSIVLE